MITKMPGDKQASMLLFIPFLLFFVFLNFTEVTFQCIDLNTVY